MAWNFVYDGVMSGTLIRASMNAASGAVVIPYANGQRVIVLQGGAA